MKNFLRRNKRLIAFVVALSFVFTTVIPENYSMVFASEISEDATSGDAIEIASSEDATINSEADVEGEAEAEEVEEEDDGIRTLYADLRESGCSITVNATSESLPYPKDELSLSVRELEEGSIEYYAYLSDAAKELGEESTDDISFARFFDIEILYNGEKVEPESPVEVKIDYDEAPEIPDGAEMNIVHFGDEGTEVINDVQLSKDASEITYDQESFSITATVVTNPTATEKGKTYALVAKYENPDTHEVSVYIVQGDGTLTPIPSGKYNTDGSGDITSVETDSPMMWTYAIEDGKTYLQYNAEGYDFDWTKQATNFAKGYIDPTSESGVATESVVRVEDRENPQWYESSTITYFDDIREHCDIVLDNQKHIYHLEGVNGYSFITVDPENKKLIGALTPYDDDQLKAINTTHFYLADVDDSIGDIENDDLPKNHMVNHIDISVSDVVTPTIPLAYGTYYDENGNVLLTIDKNSPEELKNTKVTKEVKIKQEYLRTAKIETTCNGSPIDDVFCITGYSANAPSGNTGVQVRIEGRFKVADLPAYSSSNPDGYSERLDHQIRYKITAVQPHEVFTYTDPRNPDQILYDKNGNPVTVSGDVEISAEFGYWDYDETGAKPSNECPPIQKSWNEEDFNKWRNGAILYTGTSGMDFRLTGESKVTIDPVAVEINKDIVDTNGNPIIPNTDIDDLSFNIYENAGGNHSEVLDLNVGTYTREADYSGYIEAKTVTIGVSSDDSAGGKGIVNTHDVSQGLVYISEDVDSIPKEIIDKQGNIWLFKNTVIETEYVWRQDGDENKSLHVSKTYTPGVDTDFRSVPEILGAYENELFNGFLEFYVHNIYEKYEAPKKSETSPYIGDGVLGAVKVDDYIEYKIEYKNYKSTAATVTIKDVLDSNVHFEDASDGGSCSTSGSTPGGTVTWTLDNVQAGQSGYVTLRVKVLESALESKNGPGKVINGANNTTTVQVDTDPEVPVGEVENPVPEVPSKKETIPYVGKGNLGGVDVGTHITYEINYINYKSDACDITISDTLDDHVKFVIASDNGTCSSTVSGGTVTWTLPDVPAGESGTVTLTVEVLSTALVDNSGPGYVVNGGGTSAYVKVGNDNEYYLERVENPVPKTSEKKETAPYVGTGTLGPVSVGKQITYQITYQNYKDVAANIVITDTLDDNVKFISATDGGVLSPTGSTAGGKVTWTIDNVASKGTGQVSLTVEVLEGALESNGGPGKVVNGGDTSTIKVNGDNAYSLDVVENPVIEPKKEISPYNGTGVLGGVDVGTNITYQIDYKNYKDVAADIVIKDKLDTNVSFVSASDSGSETGGVVTWTIPSVAPGTEGSVTLTVKVEDGAKTAKKVVNGGDDSTIKVGDDPEYNLNFVENPIPKSGEKTEVTPYTGMGTLGGVKVGDEIEYKIEYINYMTTVQDIVVKDTLDPNVELVGSKTTAGYTESGGVVTWNISGVGVNEHGFLTLTVKVLDGALESKGGPGEVVNGGKTTTVKVGSDPEYSLNEITNPVPEPPTKKETSPYKGTGTLGAVNVGDDITYEITYKNYKDSDATVVIEDKLDDYVDYVSSSDNGSLSGGVVTWTLTDVHAGEEGKVTLTVKVKESARTGYSPAGPGKVVNGGTDSSNNYTATVKVGSDDPYGLEKVENPVPEKPTKKEISPYDGNGERGAVKVGDNITYQIECKNYKNDAADIVIKDKLDTHVKFESASNGGKVSNGTVTWTLKNVPAGETRTVTVTVKVLNSALKSNNGPGKVVNNGDTATVKVGNDNEFKLDTVTNPVPDNPVKRETSPGVGTGELCAVTPGQLITYEIAYKNYKSTAADIKIKDKLDKYVDFESASDGGSNSGGVVNWTISGVNPGDEGVVTLTVRVKDTALYSKGGPGRVVNGGSTSTVQVGNDPEYSLNTVSNPVPENPSKIETSPYSGNGVRGAVQVGDVITYEISFKNYKTSASTVKVKDTLDSNVEFVSASDGGTETNGVVNWTIDNVGAGKIGKVTLTVRVLEGALVSKGGPGKVVNGGTTSTVQVGNDSEVSLDTVENPVPESPSKKEVTPYSGNGVLGEVSVGDTITYEISYKNYMNVDADINIKDQLDSNVEYVSSSDNGSCAGGLVTWTIPSVAAGEEGKVTLTVKVLKGALKSNNGPGKVVNGGDTATVQVGNDKEFTLEVVENPVKEPKSPDKPVDPKDPEKTGGDGDSSADSSATTPKDPEKKETKVTPPDASGSANSTPSKSTTKTGDTIPFIPMIIVMIISGVGIAVLFTLKRRIKKQD